MSSSAVVMSAPARRLIACALGVVLLGSAVACTSSSGSDASASSSNSTAAAESAVTGDQTDPSLTPDETTAPSVPSEGAPAESAAPSADAVTTQPPVSTSGPAPTTGNINEVVPDVPIVTNPPVPMDGEGDFGGQVTVRLPDISAIDASARLPGEISGPAVAVTVEIQNDSSDAIGLDSVSVDAFGPGATPTSAITTDPAAPLSGVLNPGETKSGVYVFTMPQDARGDVQVIVSYSVGSPTVVFTGSVPGG